MLDWEAIRLETLVELKKARGCAKGIVTKNINEINNLMLDPRNVDIIRERTRELKQYVREFQNAHEAYHAQLRDEGEILESTRYYNTALDVVNDLEHRIDLWNTELEARDLIPDLQLEPEDSVSNAGSYSASRVSRRSSAGSRSSARSVSSARAKAAARKAILEAEAAALSKLNELQEEELRLIQRKRELKFRTDIAKAKAEEQVYAEVEAQDGRDYPFPDPPQQLATASHPPVSGVSEPVSEPREAKELIAMRPLKTEMHLDGHQLNPNATEFRHEVAVSRQPSKEPRTVQINEHSFVSKMVEAQIRQADAFQQLLRQQQESILTLTLPQPDVPVFNGDPIDYNDFVRAFENLIERKTSSANARLYYLVQYTAGEVQQLMRSCLSMREDEGYREARRLLLERYGQPFRIATAYVDKVTNGPPIKTEDGPALQRFSVLLTSCSNALAEVGYLNKLENPEGLKKIIDRLPYGLRLKWRDAVDTIAQRENRDVTLKDIADFVASRARAANHPIFGQITETRNTPNQGKPKPKARSYATQGKQLSSGAPNASKVGKCPSCENQHRLSQCDKFKKMSVEERMKFVRMRKLCVNCFSFGHFVRDCPKASFCRVEGCSGKHSTFLHLKKPNANPAMSNTKDKGQENTEQVAVTDDSSSGYVKTSHGLNPPGYSSGVCLPMVPVRVRASGRSDTVLTYAFLDPGSNTTFCTDKLLRELNVKGEPTTISLTTMQGTNERITGSVIALEVLHLKKHTRLELQRVISRPKLPVSIANAATQEEIQAWPHLSSISLPRINAEVGLLIGCDAPEALQPREIIESRHGGPYATRTILGWVVNGPLHKMDETHIVNFISAETRLNEQFERFCNLEFNDSSFSTKAAMSKNDKRALDVMEGSVRLNN